MLGDAHRQRLLVLFAHAALADGASQNDEAFYRGLKIAVAAFFAILPEAGVLMYRKSTTTSCARPKTHYRGGFRHRRRRVGVFSALGFTFATRRFSSDFGDRPGPTAEFHPVMRMTVVSHCQTSARYSSDIGRRARRRQVKVHQSMRRRFIFFSLRPSHVGAGQRSSSGCPVTGALVSALSVTSSKAADASLAPSISAHPTRPGIWPPALA